MNENLVQNVDTDVNISQLTVMEDIGYPKYLHISGRH